MKCTFIGVGSAFDEKQTNTSVLIEDAGSRILLDCGYNAAHAYARRTENPSRLDAVWISHFHGDHFFGLPFLIGYLHTTQRDNCLYICGPAGVSEKVCAAIDLAYPTLRSKLGFEIIFQEFAPGESRSIAGIGVQTCKMDHSESALAVRLESGGKAVFYTGDGKAMKGCLELAYDADLGIMESYGLYEAVKGHSTVSACIDFAKEAKIKQVALVHLEPFVRTCMRNQVLGLLREVESEILFLPEEGQVIDIE